MRLANDQVEKLKPALAQAGTKEVGGQLFGEQLAPSDFRITEVAIQARRGSFARFMVDLVEAGRNPLRFFDRTQHEYSGSTTSASGTATRASTSSRAPRMSRPW